MSTQDDGVDRSQPPRRMVTVRENVGHLRSPEPKPATVKENVQAVEKSIGQSGLSIESDTLAFRPTHRPSMAVLTVQDDGEETGETIRIRDSRFEIGRAEGDLIIPHDGGLSGKHAEISRRWENGQFNWYLKDLQSTNGTFVKVSRVILGPQKEILLGSRRYHLEEATPAPLMEAQARPNATRKWQVDGSSEIVQQGIAALVELNDQGTGQRFNLTGTEHWLGRDPSQCSIVIDDRMLNPRHARLHRDAKGRWEIENSQSRNGLWLRVAEAMLDRGGQFQCGEQRFVIKIL